MVTPRKVVSGLAAAAVAFGVLAGCGDDGTIDTDNAKSVVNDAGQGAESAVEDATGGGDADGEGGAGEGEDGAGEGGDDAAAGGADKVQGTIDELLADKPVTFSSGSTELADESKATLKEIATAAKDAGVGLKVTTRSGAPGDAGEKLASERADAIKAELVANGMSEDDIKTDPVGNEPDENGKYYPTITAE